VVYENKILGGRKMIDNITENDLYVSRVNFLVKEIRRIYDKAQKAKDQGNTKQYEKFYNKYIVYKTELAELREVG
jgi:hypothetical protein